MSEAEMIAWIDKATLAELLEKWRFAPSGDRMMQGHVGEHFVRVMAAKRTADPAGWVRASKSIGWSRR